MNVKQTAYFMALVGAIAGLACWITQAWLTDLLRGDQSLNWLFVGLSGTLMGAFIGGLTVGFADHWTSDRVVPSWVVIGILLGALAGFLSGLLYIPLEGRVARLDPRGFPALVGRSLIWVIAGGLIGLVTGLRWVGANPLRAIHALAGGLVGGTFGGLVVGLGTSHEFVQALAYMLTGTGITLGVTLAPVLLSDGVLRFISSGDARAQNKYGSPRQEWVVQDGDRFVIGSQSADMSSTMWSQDVQVYIPDAMVSRRHAILFAKKKRFFIQLHPDNAGPHGQPIGALQVGDDNVVGTRELRHGDELVVGQTLLRFLTTRKQQGHDTRRDGRDDERRRRP
jgi:hypothetical protein